MAPKRKRKNGKAGLRMGATEAMAILRHNPACASTLSGLAEAFREGGMASESLAEDLVGLGFLLLVPSILSQSSSKCVRTGIEVVGALSISSLGTHRKVVSDKDVMRAVKGTFASSDVDLLVAACHAVSDLLITPAGREALAGVAVDVQLLRLLSRIADSLNGARGEVVFASPTAAEVPGKCTGEQNPRVAVSRISTIPPESRTSDGETAAIASDAQNASLCGELDELVTAVLMAMSALLRDGMIGPVSSDVLDGALDFLRRAWRRISREDRSLLEATAGDDEPKWTRDRPKRHLVATCLARLAMERDRYLPKNLSTSQGDFEAGPFREEYWEQRPVLLAKTMPFGVPSPSMHFASAAEAIRALLGTAVACPPAFAGPVDPLHLFQGCIESTLGEPMIYGQDIRLVKTVLRGPETAVELHYDRDGTVSKEEGARHVHLPEILEAAERGYTVAVRGMQLRRPDIAAIAECVARQCGQPSVGVNLYLTPPDAQGLDLHFDDHCVFVCQLVGIKTWHVFPPQKVLPRLYASRAFDREAVLRTGLAAVFTLEEGDVLYVPRGFLHRAHSGRAEETSGSCLIRRGDSSVDESSGTSRNGGAVPEHSSETGHCCPGQYSLHLTFGVEVEPPFEWEGFLHIALRLWADQRWEMISAQDDLDGVAPKYSHGSVEQLCEGLLHIAIYCLGEKELRLRKACNIAAAIIDTTEGSQDRERSLGGVSSGSGCGMDASSVCRFCDPGSVEFYQALVELVAREADYGEAHSFAQRAVDDDSVLVGRLEWLKCVPHSIKRTGTSLSDPLSNLSKMMKTDGLAGSDSFELETTFVRMKGEYGQALMFHAAAEGYRSVWNQYWITRAKFNSGMLAVHDCSP